MVRGLVIGTGHRAAIVNQIEFEIELRAVERAGNRADIQVRQLDRPHIGVLPRNHHLEYRRMTEPSRRLHDFHDLFEREILVILRGDKEVILEKAVFVLDQAQLAGAQGFALATKKRRKP